MMLRSGFTKVLCGVVLLWSAAASAQQAWTTRQVSVRAGPDPSYPPVATLNGGYAVEVLGCLSDYSWCDVAFNRGYDRGWVPARRLQYMYQSRRVPLYDYSASIGLPIVTFSLLNYWDSNYRNRSWYHERPRYHSAPHSNWGRDSHRDGGGRRDYRPNDNNWQRDQPRHNQSQYNQQQYNQQQYNQQQYNQRQHDQRQYNPQQAQPQPNNQQQLRGQDGNRDGSRRGTPQGQALPQGQPSPRAQAAPPPVPAQPVPSASGQLGRTDASGQAIQLNPASSQP